jgi:hypothetical protein
MLLIDLTSYEYYYHTQRDAPDFQRNQKVTYSLSLSPHSPYSHSFNRDNLTCNAAFSTQHTPQGSSLYPLLQPSRCIAPNKRL